LITLIEPYWLLFEKLLLDKKAYKFRTKCVTINEFIYTEAGMTAQTSFGQWLKQRRKALDITREDLAQQIGCALSTLYKIEADQRRPSKQIAALLGECLNIPPEERLAFVRFARAEAAENAAPWGTAFHPPTNLTAQPTLLIGRGEDVASIRKRLLRNEARLLTLIGPPGIGKTRLALAVADEIRDDFADGVFFVTLTPISDASLVLPTIATTLGIPDAGPHTTLERLKVFLRDKQMLVVLDNFEQILSAAPKIAELLSVCPLLKLLVTSRSPLRIRQERQFPVSPLALPDLASLPDTDTLSQYAAVTLFLEWAQAVQPDFSLNDENAPTVAAICARLDGLPLAIELISARVKLLSPAALLERLGGRLMLQSDGLRDLEPRHRTLNAAIDWSYQLLSAQEQVLFHRLGVFVGGWTLEAAEAVCMENLELTVLDGLASLLDKNLIKREMRADGEPHFMMLETIREYALEQLVASGELDDLRQRHIDYFLTLAEGAEAHAFGHEQIAWFDRLEVEFDNLRAALTWSLELETGLRLAAALGWFFSERSHWNEGFDWLERMLTSNPDAPASLRAKAFHSAGALAGLIDAGSFRARALCEQALALARSANDRWNIAWSLSHLGNYTTFDDPDQQASCLDESLALFRVLDDAMGIAHTLLRRAWVAFDHEDYPHSRRLAEEALRRAREAGDKITAAWASNELGRVAWHQDHDYGQTRTYFESSASLFREAHSHFPNPLVFLADVEQAMGNSLRAQILYEEALISQQSLPRGWDLSYMFVGLASVTRSLGQPERAAQLLGIANGIALTFQHDAFDFPNFKQDVAEVREQLGETAFAEAWAAGNAMTQRQAIVYALNQTV
jgi:predicted ATPase/DNA-binding XRE family transcriptional regulator